MTFPSLLLAACLPLLSDGDRITAADLARAEPAFTALPADTPLGYAPAPGTHRTFGVAELARVAQRYGLALEPRAGICLERAVEPLAPAQLLEAIQVALGIPDARIEILDYSRHPVPQGRIEFFRTALAAPPPSQSQASALWTGAVRYGGNRRFAIWARVRILVQAQRVVAAQALPAGHPIEMRHLRLEDYEGFPPRVTALASMELAVGRAPRRSISAGTVLSSNQLAAPYEIARGAAVRVEVSSGDAHIEMEGRAESDGRAGQTIPIRNPANGKRFQARVEGPGKVVAGVHP
jgi:flagella basal body P-ring formation protein FlgA